MKIVHTMIRVNDLDESLKFYCDGLGMKLLKKESIPRAVLPTSLSVMVRRKPTQSSSSLIIGILIHMILATVSGTSLWACPMFTRPAKNYALKALRSSASPAR